MQQTDASRACWIQRAALALGQSKVLRLWLPCGQAQACMQSGGQKCSWNK
jgi:hypothetical protein